MKKSILILLLCSFLPLSLYAQNHSGNDPKVPSYANRVGFGPIVGYYKSADSNSGSWILGGQLRGRLGSFVGLEGSLEYRSSQKYQFTLLGGSSSTKVRQVPATLSLMIFPPVGNGFTSYILGGVGAYFNHYSNSDGSSSSDTKVGYHLGLGVEIPIVHDVTLQFDYRYLFMNGSSSKLADKKFSGNVIDGGVMFYL